MKEKENQENKRYLEGLKSSAEFIKSPEEILQSVSVGIVERGGKFWIGKRWKENYSGRWAFPGGKLKPGETPRQCLERELNEELGVRVIEAEPLLEWDCRLSDGKTFHLIAFRCKIDGDPELNVHSEGGFYSIDEIMRLDILEGDTDLLIALKSMELADKKALTTRLEP